MKSQGNREKKKRRFKKMKLLFRELPQMILNSDIFIYMHEVKVEMWKKDKERQSVTWAQMRAIWYGLTFPNWV
jgi:hypothetical protein